ncbi:unnamed protein product [Acanthoscelides obtectus]|uniref:Uncharacterized protein n=1 Tax=Acanthoscelides obtectus TaxID=200917 RepID=A0A9P0Q7G7_ACAOB|nr:unnamed protein product [Acanthoscelides obtectus]CAK1670250.1 hypothetical protein AOBTE_LOCUS27508 [Acanthoscelides obtectus]
MPSAKDRFNSALRAFATKSMTVTGLINMEFVLMGCRVGTCCPPKVVDLVSSDTEFIKKLLNVSSFLG